MGIDLASVGRRGRNSHRQKMVEELRKRLGESLKVKTSNSEELRLTYFPARGRAEISRLILAHAGVKFDDIRLSGEEFGKVKPLLPYGSMPILENKAKADEIVLAVNGIFESVAKCLFAPEGEKAGQEEVDRGDIATEVWSA